MDKTGQNGLYSVKMCASRGGAHISGAERIVPSDTVAKTAAALAERALSHPKGAPDFVNIKIEGAGSMLRLKALPVSTNVTHNAAEGIAKAAELLAGAGITRIDEIMSLFSETYAMRGAMLLDADTLERLEPAIRYPTVARGSARLRCAIMSAHTEDQLRAAADAIANACRSA